MILCANGHQMPPGVMRENYVNTSIPDLPRNPEDRVAPLPRYWYKGRKEDIKPR